MKIVCISDTHNQQHRLSVPDGDLLIHAGDLSIYGTVEEINSALKWLAQLPHKHKIVVAGNHDFAFEHKSFGLVIPDGITYLENSTTEVAGFKVWGSPVCPPFYKWAFMWPLHQRQELYESIPDGIDIVISHSPVMGILDYANRGCHAGCPALMHELRTRVRPRLCVSGHIHEDAGLCEVDGTLYVNASMLNKQYDIANQARVIELEHKIL